MSLFVDTSAWYAAADRSDRSNARAQEILAGGEKLVTTDHVLVETWLLLCHRLGEPVANEFWRRLRGGVARLESVVSADMEAAWAIGEIFEDQHFSLVDRTSFAVMERLGIVRAASLDSDFAVYRFGPGRRMAFEVLG